MSDKWRIDRVTTIQTIRGEKIVRHRWWLTKPDNMWQSWSAQKVGTFEECRLEFIRVQKRLAEGVVPGRYSVL